MSSASATLAHNHREMQLRLFASLCFALIATSCLSVMANDMSPLAGFYVPPGFDAEDQVACPAGAFAKKEKY
jgi:hypothetical protein